MMYKMLLLHKIGNGATELMERMLIAHYKTEHSKILLYFFTILLMVRLDMLSWK
jgi:hypothetical protein